MSNSLRAIKNNTPHRVSPTGQDYESLARQNETFASIGISPTSSKGYQRRRGYNPARDPNVERVGVNVDPELLAETLGLSGRHKKKYLRTKVDDD